jgi:hypothetical protein
MTVYAGPVSDSDAVIQFLRQALNGMHALRRLVISPEKTVVLDVNGDGVEFPGLTYGCPVLNDLLRELGVIFTPQKLHDPNATADGIKEFRLSARHPWGEDRVM